MFPSTAAILADQLGADDAAAYDLSAGCTGFVYALAQAYGMLARGLSRRALVVGADVLSKLMDFADRSTCVLFGDGAGAVVLERVARGRASSASSSAPTARAASISTCPPAARACPTTAETVASGAALCADERPRGLQVRDARARQLGRERCSTQAGLTVEDVDVYVPHQANVRIIDHAVGKLGIPEEKVVVNVDRYGNTSSGSIPLALADARRDGRLQEGRHRADDGNGCRADLGLGA